MSVIFQSFKDYTINHPYMIIKNNKHDIKNSERDYFFYSILWSVLWRLNNSVVWGKCWLQDDFHLRLVAYFCFK